MQVGERGPPHRNDVPHPGMTAFPPNAEVGELVIHEVFDGRKFPAIPDQIQEAANNRAVVLPDLITEIAPGIKRVAMIFNPGTAPGGVRRNTQRWSFP